MVNRLAKISSIDKGKGFANVIYLQTNITSVKLPIIVHVLPELKINDVVLVADTDDGSGVIVGKIFNSKYKPIDFKNEHEKYHKKMHEKHFPEIAKKKCKNYEAL